MRWDSYDICVYSYIMMSFGIYNIAKWQLLIRNAYNRGESV